MDKSATSKNNIVITADNATRPTNKHGTTKGRKPTINPLMELEFLNLLQVGTPINKACDIVGISDAAIYAKMSWDKNFQSNVNKARALLSSTARKNVSQALEQGNIQVSTWYLERKERDEFGAKLELDNNINIQANDNKPLQEKLEEMIANYNKPIPTI